MQVTVDQARAIIAEPKIAVKPLEWVEKIGRSPKWVEYSSACEIQSEVREDVMFISTYRAKKYESKGLALIEMPEIFNAAICVANKRIIAIDTTSRPHKNTVGKGLPYYGKILNGRTHVHIWTGTYGYAEPFSKDLNDLESLMDEFLRIAHVSLVGEFIHPMKNTSGILPI
jgi:hypothetical protein